MPREEKPSEVLKALRAEVETCRFEFDEAIVAAEVTGDRVRRAATALMHANALLVAELEARAEVRAKRAAEVKAKRAGK